MSLCPESSLPKPRSFRTMTMVPPLWTGCFPSIISCDMTLIRIPILWMRRLRLRKVKGLGVADRDPQALRSVHLPLRDLWNPSLTLLTLAVYCFMAIFSKALSKPKKDRMSSEADCSKHVQSSFSGWTWKPGRGSDMVSVWETPCPPQGALLETWTSYSMQWTARHSLATPKGSSSTKGPCPEQCKV